MNANPVPVTSTAVDGTAPTTTVYKLVLATTTVTEQPEKTVSTRTTSCTTSTVVETYAAPTFTKAYGPKAGCADVAPGRAVRLDENHTNLPDATHECRSLCEQDTKCEFVYVQRLFDMKSDGKAYYGCVLNEQHLDTSKDLKCQKKAGIWGVAVGFNANGRGTEPLA